MLAFQAHCPDVVEAEAQIDCGDCVLKFVAPSIPLQGAGYRKPGLVEVVQEQQRDVVFEAHFVGQLASCNDAHSLGTHDRNVEAFGDLRDLQQ